MPATFTNREKLVDAVAQAGPWFHQIDLPFGVRTRDIAPTPGPQPLDHPRRRWDLIAPHLPEDMAGMRVLDIGCADGFFSVEVARRGATVVAMDLSRDRINRVAFVAEVLDLDGLEARRGSIDEVDESLGDFDVVLFLALLYHLGDAYGGLRRLMPRARRMILETAAIHDPRPYLVFDPPGVSHLANPKLFPTTGCVEQMLEAARCQSHDLFAMTTPKGDPVDPADPAGSPGAPGDDLSRARRVRALWLVEGAQKP